MRGWATVGLFILAITGAPASPAPVVPDAPGVARIDHARLTRFRENSLLQARPGGRAETWAHLLFDSAEDAGGDVDATLDAFAAQIGVPRADAAEYGALIIQGSEIERCRRDQACDPAPHLARLEQVALAEPTGRLIFALLPMRNARHVTPGYADVLARHPEFLNFALELYLQRYEFLVADKALRAGIADTPMLEALLTYDRSGDNPDFYDRLDAYREGLARAPVGDASVLARALLVRQLLAEERAGEALAEYDAAPADERSRFIDLLAQGQPAFSPFGQRAHEMLRALMEAFNAAGRREDAGALGLAMFTAMNESDSYRRRMNEFIAEMQNPSWMPDEIYNAMIFGKTNLDWAADAEAFDSMPGPSPREGGLLFALRQESEELRRQAAAYLRSADFPEMAVYIDPDSTPPAGARSPSTETRPGHVTERSLPGGFSPNDATPEYGNTPSYAPPAIPPGLLLPIPARQVARLERDGAEITVIYRSSDADPIGDFSSGGHWLIRSRDGGATWTDSAYLGFQDRYPYVVLPDSQLPLWDGDTLRIEVEVVAFDYPDELMRPFRGMEYRKTRGRYIELDWVTVTRDADDDGLTDILETRVGLNPQRPDTDGDGQRDGADMAPLTAQAEEPGEYGALMQAVMAHLMRPPERVVRPYLETIARGEEMEGERLRVEAFAPQTFQAVKIFADPALFEGFDPAQRILVYDSAGLGALDPVFGEFWPRRLTILPNHDRTQAYFTYSYPYGGSSYIIRRTDDGWEVVQVSSYVV